MKTAYFLLAFLTSSYSVTAQQASINQLELFDYKMPPNESGKKKKTATILLVSGTAIAATGIAFMVSGLADGGSFEAFNDDDFESNDARFMGGFLATHIGAGLALASIPFFKKSRQLRNNAVIQFKRELAPAYASGAKIFKVPQLQLGITFPLAK